MTRTKLDSSILIVAPDSPTSFSPAGERIRNLAIASRGFFLGKTVVLTVGRPESLYKRGAREEGIILYTINLPRAMPNVLAVYIDPIRLCLFLIYAALLAHRYRPKYVVASLPPIEVGISACVVSKICSTKLIVDLRDDWERAYESMHQRLIPRALFKPLFSLARRIYSSSVGIFVVTKTLSNAKVAEAPRIYVPNGADTSLFFPRDGEVRKRLRLKYSLPPDKAVMVYSGSGLTPYSRSFNVVF